MLEASKHDFCSEFYLIEKSVEVVVHIHGESETLRIEALRDLRDGHYCTRSFIQEHLTIQSTYPQSNGNFGRKPEEFRVWVSYDLPWIDRDSADGAIEQALGFLSEHCR